MMERVRRRERDVNSRQNIFNDKKPFFVFKENATFKDHCFVIEFNPADEVSACVNESFYIKDVLMQRSIVIHFTQIRM